MKAFSERRRLVEETRKKYGKPETKKEALERLKKENEEKKNILKLKEEARKRNKDEFHFSYYTVGRNMTKRTRMDKFELKKLLIYVDREIKRSERILEERIQKGKSEHEEYLEELKRKRKEIFDKMQ